MEGKKQKAPGDEVEIPIHLRRAGSKLNSDVRLVKVIPIYDKEVKVALREEEGDGCKKIENSEWCEGGGAV